MEKAVIFFATFNAAYEGNFIPTLRELAGQLKPRGYQTLLIFPQRVSQFDWTKKLHWCAEVKYLSGSIPADTRMLTELMKRYRIQLVHTHFVESKHLVEIKLARAACHQNFPIIEHHRAQFPVPGNPAKRTLKFRIMKDDYLLGCSKSVETGLKESGLKNKDIASIDNAIDFQRFPNAGKGLTNHSILMFGYNIRIKGVDVALLACRELVKEIPDLKLRVCVAAHMEEVTAGCKELLGELPPWLELLPPSADVGQYYNNANIFLSASREEGFCNAVIEAAFSRCSVVSSAIDGPKQLKLPDITWFESENSQNLANVLRSTFAMPDEDALALKNRLHNSAEENYQVSRWVRQVMEYYESRRLI